MGRLDHPELHIKLCPDCNSRMDPLRVDEGGIIWECRFCKFQVTEHYKDTERVVYNNKKAWEN